MSKLTTEIRAQVLRKAMREQPKELALRALWAAIKESAKEHCYSDGFLDWNLVRGEFDELLGEDDE